MGLYFTVNRDNILRIIELRQKFTKNKLRFKKKIYSTFHEKSQLFKGIIYTNTHRYKMYLVKCSFIQSRSSTLVLYVHEKSAYTKDCDNTLSCQHNRDWRSERNIVPVPWGIKHSRKTFTTHYLLTRSYLRKQQKR